MRCSRTDGHKKAEPILVFPCQGFDALKNLKKIWSLLQDHWKTYTKKYHMMGVEECIDNNNLGKADCSDEEEGNDDDCMVLLPGEENGDFEKAVESDSNFKDPVELPYLFS